MTPFLADVEAFLRPLKLQVRRLMVVLSSEAQEIGNE